MPPFREHLNREHTRSPYVRAPGSQANSPAVNRNRRQPSTPGSIFSRVKQMFSPKTWGPDKNPTIDDSIGEFDDSDTSLQSFQSDVSRVVSNPIDEFHRVKRQSSIQQLRHQQYQHQSISSTTGADSPNVRLAKFFANKGSEPLSEIEMEGVRALLAQSASPSTSPKTPRVSNLSDDGNEEENVTNESLVLKAETTAASPALTATPSFKATYNDSVAHDGDVSVSSNATSKRRVFDYSGFPSPYRTSRLKRSTFALNTEYEKAQKGEKDVEKPKPAEKKLSNTASALLSFIQSNEGDDVKEDKKIDEEKKEVDFSNPYARTKKPSRASVSKKPSPLEQLEMTLNAQSAQEKSQQPQQLPLVNKYKPAKSSSLRESVTVFDEDMETEEKPEEKPIERSSFGTGFASKKQDEKKESTPAFSYGAAKPEDKSSDKPSFGFGASSEKSQERESQQKPAFTSGSSTQPTPVENTMPSFSFGASTSAKPAKAGFSTGPAAVTSNHTTSTEIQKDNEGDQDVDYQEPDQKQLSPRKVSSGLMNGHSEVSVASYAHFVFPSAQDSGVSIMDVEESKVAIFKSLFTF